MSKNFKLHIYTYYMANSMSGQDKPNPTLSLATRAAKMELSCLLYHIVLAEENFLQSHIIDPFLTKLARSRWLNIGLIPFLRAFFSSRSINPQMKDMANIQPSWPHTWSITDLYLSNRPQVCKLINPAGCW